MITVKEAKRLEDSFLGGITEAQDAYEQIVANEAWTVLGYDTFTEWWSDRVAPLMRQLSMFPNRKLAGKVIEQVRADEAELPATQRRTQRELGELVGVTQQAVSARSTPDKKLSQGDLEPPTPDSGRLCDVPGHGYGPHDACPETKAVADPLPPQIAEQIEQRIAERVTRPIPPEPIQPADPEVRERLAREREEQQMRELHSGQLAKSVWLLAQYGAETDAADKFVKDWQPSQDIYPKKTTAARLRAAGDFLYALAERWPQ